MNELIKQLYVQAIQYADSVVPKHDRYNDIYYSIVSGKHAELIVKECCDEIVEMADKYATFNGNVRRHIMHGAISEKLKEHFGVQE
jgi:hypothetical protein